MENYEKIRLVGRGAFGTVYLCKQKIDDKLVILKEIPVDQMSVDERQASMNESKVLAMLDHPNVVAYYESFLEDKTLIIAMEYVQGGTLFDFLQDREDKLMSEEEVLMFFGQMVYTLQYVHAKLILHRDLKSQNIFLNENQNIVKIGDFGISKVLSSKSKAYTVVGTPCYISPELCEGKSYNQKSDIWALGCILYELMTLKRPFDATTLPALIMKIMKGSFDPVPDIYSLELKKLLFSMLQLDPTQRPSAAEIMSHPVMIKIIFKLYLEVGSIPMSNKHQTLHIKESSYEIASSKTISKLRRIPSSGKLQHCIWLFTEKEQSLLPSTPKNNIQSVSLGLNYKVGLTNSGNLISWKTCPELMISKNAGSCESIAPSLNIAYTIDEKLSVNIVSVICGNDFTICLSDNGVVYSFGKVSSGCLGLSVEKDSEQLKIVETLFGHNIKSIACGPRHVIVVSESNEVFAWGHGNLGCLGLGSTDLQVLPEPVPIKDKIKPERAFCGIDCSFLISTTNSIMACGSNRHNKLAMDFEESHQIEEVREFTSILSHSILSQKFVTICSGKAHSVFLTEQGEVYTVGSNRHSQLGWGNSTIDYSIMPQKVEKLSDVKVSKIKCGDFFTLALTTDNYMYCWGKCPQSLTGVSTVKDVGIPNDFENKYVEDISCSSVQCVVIGKNRDVIESEDCKNFK